MNRKLENDHLPWKQISAGERWLGYWATGIEAMPALPVLAVRGDSPGPQLVVTGAVHGDEYEGPAAIHTLLRETDPATIHGLVIGLPVVNVPAWRVRSRTTPVDGVDLNRVFPGNPSDGSGVSHQLAEAVFDTFVRPSDVLIDLHSGGARLIHLPMVGWYDGASEEAILLARGFGRALHPWRLFDRAGVLSYEAHRIGKIAIGAEWGGGGRLDLAGRDGYARGLRRILDYYAGRAFDDDEIDRREPITGRYQEVDAGGLFVPAVALGQRVAQGEQLGVLHDELGEPVEQISAERSGLVAALAHLAWLWPGERVAYLG